MEEIWKDIEGYEGLYQVSSEGRVKNFRDIILKPRLCNGYHFVELWKENKHKNFYIHRLVCKAFIPNPNNYPHVNHLDRVRTNNKVSNLEWTTPHLNNSYPPTLKYKSYVMTNRDDLSKPVLQLTMEGWLFKEWPSSHQIERELGYFSNMIRECCRKNSRRKSAYGFKWEYKEKAVV